MQEAKDRPVIRERFWNAATRLDVLTSLGGFFVSTGLLAWTAQRWTDVTGGSWPASIFIGIGAFCTFALALSIAAALFAVSFRKIRPLPSPPQIAPAPVQAATGPDFAERLRQLDRTSFLVATSAIDDIYRRRLRAAIAHIPRDEPPLDSDATIQSQTSKIDDFISELQGNLVGSHWIVELERHYRHAEHVADGALLSAEIPNGLNVVLYRRFTIATTRRDHIERWLISAVQMTEANEAQMLQMLHGRPELHNR